MNSKLPIEILGRVWELSDIDADGFLDREEFTVVCILAVLYLSDTKYSHEPHFNMSHPELLANT